MIHWALSVDSCLRRNDRIWIWVISTERGTSELRSANCETFGQNCFSEIANLAVCGLFKVSQTVP